MNKIKKIIAGIGLTALTYAPVQAQEQEQTKGIELGYNSIEQGITSNLEHHTRLTNKGTIHWNDASIDLHLLNQTNNLSKENFYGRNRIIVGKDGAGTKAEVDLTKIGTNPLDVKVGVRNTSLPKLLGLYGHVEATANTKAANITALLGKSLGRGFSLDAISDNEIPYQGKPFLYLELQGSKAIGKHLYGFARIESANFQKPAYMAGIGIKR